MAEDIQEKVRQRLLSLERAEAITRILCWRSGPQPDYEWRPDPRPYSRLYNRKVVTPPRTSHRIPPLPFYGQPSRAGWCRVCGQPINSGGGWRIRAARPQSTRLTWHRACTQTYFLWIKSSDYCNVLMHRQQGICPIIGQPIKYAEVDHKVPLFRVARDHADLPWCEMIRYWGLSNLQALSREGHLIKCAEEARERAGRRINPVNCS